MLFFHPASANPHLQSLHRIALALHFDLKLHRQMRLQLSAVPAVVCDFRGFCGVESFEGFEGFVVFVFLVVFVVFVGFPASALD